MKSFTRLMTLFLAFILPIAAAHAEGRSTAVIAIHDAHLWRPDGTLFRVPFRHDDYRSGGSISTENVGTDRHLSSTDNNSTFWEVSHCDGICNSGFPPEENQVPYFGYARSISQGVMPVASDSFGSSLLRTDAATRDVAAMPTRATASSYNTFDFIAQTNEPLIFVFDATPYINQYFGPGTAPGSENIAQLLFRVTLVNQSTGQEIFNMADPLLNGEFVLQPDRQGASFIHDPGRAHFTYNLGPLSAGDTYALTMTRQAIANVLLAVPEPASTTLYLVGILVVVTGIRLQRDGKTDRHSANRLQLPIRFQPGLRETLHS